MIATVTHGLCHGHYTDIHIQYHGIPMRHYPLVSILKRPWFRCSLCYLLRRRCYCKRNIHLARALNLLLLLGGDVELNPGLWQNHDNKDDGSVPAPVVSEIAVDTGKVAGVNLESLEKRHSRLAMLSDCQQKRLNSETSDDRRERLAVLCDNQRKRLQSETCEERDKRLAVLCDNQRKRLQCEGSEERDGRLAVLCDNQRKC